MAASESIVVGTDGSPTAIAEVHTAVAVAKARGAIMHVVCASGPLPAHGFGPEAAGLVDPVEEAESCLAEAASRIRSEGVEVETHAPVGGAAAALVDVAETIGA